MKINSQDSKKAKAQKQKLVGISFYLMPTGLSDVADAYIEMRLIVENEAHLRGKSMHCFLNSCTSPEEINSMFFLKGDNEKRGTKDNLKNLF